MAGISECGIAWVWREREVVAGGKGGEGVDKMEDAMQVQADDC